MIRRRESGQTIPLVALTIVVLIGFAGLAIDIGYAYVNKRKVQAAVDLGLLSGAQLLPDGAAAATDAYDHTRFNFSAAPGQPIAIQATTGCVVAGCAVPNKLTVNATTESPTFFLRLFGVDHFDVGADGAACAPCDSSPLSFDVILVLDRSYSMCLDSGGSYNGCSDMTNAVNGMKTLIPFFNIATDRIGLVLLGSADSNSPYAHTGSAAPCDTMDTNHPGYNGHRFYSTAGDFMDGTPANHDSWLVAPLANNFLNVDGTLNNSSALVSTLNCVQHKYFTPIAPAIEAAKNELVANGRPTATRVIVYFGDGGANVQPMVRNASGDATATASWYTPTSGNNLQPCHDAVGQAAVAKAAGIQVYTIGYDLNASGANNCNQNNGTTTEPGITATTTMQQMATDAAHFYNQATPGQVYSIFNAIGHAITTGGVRLVK